MQKLFCHLFLRKTIKKNNNNVLFALAPPGGTWHLPSQEPPLYPLETLADVPRRGVINWCEMTLHLQVRAQLRPFLVRWSKFTLHLSHLVGRKIGEDLNKPHHLTSQHTNSSDCFWHLLKSEVFPTQSKYVTFSLTYPPYFYS